MAMQEILPDVFRYEDSCHVYIIRRGDRAIAIDFGTGKVLDELGAIGVSGLDWIIHTHHHRDQCVGDKLAVEQGTKIAVPEWEAHYFMEAEHFFGRRSIFHLYNMRTNYYTLRESVPVARLLQDYTEFEWKDIKLEICPAPGHTEGQVALVWDRNSSGSIAFVGDLIRDDGQVQNLHDLQFNYGGWEGMPQTIGALGYLQTFNPTAFFPSHGDAVEQPNEASERLITAMRAWLGFYGGSNDEPGPDNRVAQLDEVIPGVYFSKYTNANHYAIISESGKAMFVDYGPNYSSGLVSNLLHADEGNRFTPHSMPELRALGMTEVDVAIPSHYHDDHITGFHYLARKEGTRIWCYENMVDVLSNPAAEIVGCTVPIPLPIDRAIGEGEEVKWEEFTFTVHHTPGHADYHMTMFCEHEGRRIAFTGDNIFNGGSRDDQGRLNTNWNLIPLNRNRPDDHLKTAECLLEFEPEIILPGHGGPFEIERDDLLKYRDQMAKVPTRFQALIGDRDVNQAMDWYASQVFPYEQSVESGKPVEATVKLKNYDPESANGTITAALPDGWTADHPVQKVHIHGGGKAEVKFTIIPGDRRTGSPGKVPYGFAVEMNGKPLGEPCHGIGNYLRYAYLEPGEVNGK
jgi:glyoxylase-like metal-dependent hydrolase (beta-lactamase superfamily II)